MFNGVSSFFDSIQVMKIVLSRIFGILEGCFSWRNVLVLFIVTQIVYGIILGFTIPMVTEYSSGMKLLDTMPMGYNSAYVERLLNILGEEGRRLYLSYQIPVDMVYPGLFAVAHSLLLMGIFRKNFWLHGKVRYFVLVPIFAGAFDYLENIGIIIMILIYPKFIPIVADLTSMFSMLKSIFTTLFFGTLIVSLIFLALRIRVKEQALR